MPHDLALTLNFAIVCITLLVALHMFRRSIDRVSRQPHSVFVLLLPFGVSWVFAGGANPAEVEQLVTLALSRRGKTRQPHDDVASLNQKNQRAQ